MSRFSPSKDRRIGQATSTRSRSSLSQNAVNSQQVGPPKGTFTDEELAEKSKRLSETHTIATREAIKANTSRIIAAKLKVLGTQSASDPFEEDTKLWKKSSQINAQLKELQQEKHGGGSYSSVPSHAKRQEKLWKLTLPIKPDSDATLSLNDQIIDQARTEFAVHYLETSNIPPTHDNINLIRDRIKIGKENVQLRTLSRGYLENSILIEASGIRDIGEVLQRKSQDTVKHVIKVASMNELAPLSGSASPMGQSSSTQSFAQSPSGTSRQRAIERLEKREAKKKQDSTSLKIQLANDPTHVKRMSNGLLLPNEWLHEVPDISSHLYTQTVSRMDDHWEFQRHQQMERGEKTPDGKRRRGAEKRQHLNEQERWRRKIRTKDQPMFVNDMNKPKSEDLLERERRTREQQQQLETKQVMFDRIHRMKEEKSYLKGESKPPLDGTAKAKEQHDPTHTVILSEDPQIMKTANTPLPTAKSMTSGTASALISAMNTTRPDNTPTRRETIGESFLGHLASLDLIISPELIERVWVEFGHPGEDVAEDTKSQTGHVSFEMASTHSISNHSNHQSLPIPSPSPSLPLLQALQIDTLGDDQQPLNSDSDSPHNVIQSSSMLAKQAKDKQATAAFMLASSKSPNVYLRFKQILENDEAAKGGHLPSAGMMWEWIEQHFVYPFSLRDDRELNSEYLSYIKRKRRSRVGVREKEIREEEEEERVNEDVTSEEYWMRQLKQMQDEIEREQREIRLELDEAQTQNTAKPTSSMSGDTFSSFSLSTSQFSKKHEHTETLHPITNRDAEENDEEDDSASFDELRTIVPDPTPDELSVYLKAFVAEFPFDRLNHRVNRQFVTTAIHLLHHPLFNRTLRMTIRLVYFLFVMPLFFPTVEPSNPQIPKYGADRFGYNDDPTWMDPRFSFCFMSNADKEQFISELSPPLRLLLEETPHSIHVISHPPTDHQTPQKRATSSVTSVRLVTVPKGAKRGGERYGQQEEDDEREENVFQMETREEEGGRPLTPVFQDDETDFGHIVGNVAFKQHKPARLDIHTDSKVELYTPSRSPFYPPVSPQIVLSLISPTSVNSRHFPPHTAHSQHFPLSPAMETMRAVASSSPFSALPEVIPPFSSSLIDQTFLSLAHSFAPLFQLISSFREAGLTLFLPLAILAIQSITRAVLERTYGTGISENKSKLDGCIEWKFTLKQITHFLSSVFDPSKSAQRFSALESSIQSITLLSHEGPRQSQNRMSRNEEDETSKHTGQSSLYFSISPFVESVVSSSSSAGTRRILSNAGKKTPTEDKPEQKQQFGLNPKWSVSSLSSLLCDESKNALFLLSVAVRKKRAPPPTDGRYRDVNSTVVEKKREVMVVRKEDRGKRKREEKEIEYTMDVMKKKSDSLLSKLDDLWNVLKDNTIADTTCITEDNLASVLFMQEVHPIDTSVERRSFRDTPKQRQFRSKSSISAFPSKKGKRNGSPADTLSKSTISTLERQMEERRRLREEIGRKEKAIQNDLEHAEADWLNSLSRSKKSDLLRWSTSDDFTRTSIGSEFLPTRMSFPAPSSSTITPLNSSFQSTHHTVLPHIQQPRRPPQLPVQRRATEPHHTAFHFKQGRLKPLPIVRSDEEIRKLDEEERMLRTGSVAPPRSLVAASHGEMNLANLRD